MRAVLFRWLLAVPLALLVAAPVQAQSPDEMLVSGIRAYDDLEFTAAAEFLGHALAEAEELLPGDRTRARAYLAAASIFLNRPDSAAAIFRTMLEGDPRYRIDELIFPPQVSRLFDQVRRRVHVVSVSAPVDTSIAPGGGGYRVRAYASSLHRVTADVVDVRGQVVDTLYEGPIGDSLSLRWRPLGEPGGAPVPSGEYTLRIRSLDDAARPVRRVELPLDLSVVPPTHLPAPPPLADSVLLPERRPPGPGVRALVGGLVAGAAIAGLSGAIASDADLSGRRFVAGAGVSLAGVIGFILQRPGATLHDNVATNAELRAAWQRQVEEIRAENARRDREAGARVRAGTPRTVVPEGP